MARLVKLRGPLRFRSNDPQAEQPEKKMDPVDTIVPKTLKSISPFQRAKNGTGDFFLAADAVPTRNRTN